MEPDRQAQWRLYAESVRTWLPIVLSLCAISLTVFQAYSTRRHTRLSVQPRLEWRVSAGQDGALAYRIDNDGFGPAILKELRLDLDGAPVGSDGPATCAEIDRRLGRGAPDWETGCFDMDGDFVIRAGAGVTVYTSRPKSAAAQGQGPAVDYLRLTPMARYCSFYEDCWPLE